jgi:hypothetical protein
MTPQITREEALRRNAELDGLVESLDPLWHAALEARNKAQAVIDEYQAFRRRVLDMQVANVQAITDQQ